MINRVAFAIALMALSAPCLAQEVQVGPDRYAVTLRRADLQSTSPAATRRSLARIDRAAMAICGASGSLLAVKRAVRRSACWRESMTDALQRIDDPQLSHAWQDRR